MIREVYYEISVWDHSRNHSHILGQYCTIIFRLTLSLLYNKDHVRLSRSSALIILNNLLSLNTRTQVWVLKTLPQFLLCLCHKIADLEDDGPTWRTGNMRHGLKQKQQPVSSYINRSLLWCLSSGFYWQSHDLNMAVALTMPEGSTPCRNMSVKTTINGVNIDVQCTLATMKYLECTLFQMIHHIKFSDGATIKMLAFIPYAGTLQRDLVSWDVRGIRRDKYMAMVLKAVEPFAWWNVMECNFVQV